MIFDIGHGTLEIQGLFNSVVHGPDWQFSECLNIQIQLACTFKGKGSGNLDPGVCDDSSSEYSEYD